MAGDRLFLDTVYFQALLNRRDQLHPQALGILPRVRSAEEVWVTEAVLIEVANALSSLDRAGAARLVMACFHTPNVRVVPVDTGLLRRGLGLYAARGDKEWGLTDCISFVVMQDQGLTLAVTADHHFIQAGFQALLRKPAGP